MTAQQKMTLAFDPSQVKERVAIRRGVAVHQAQLALTNWYVQKLFDDGTGEMDREKARTIMATREYKIEHSDAFSVFKEMGDTILPLFEKFNDLEPFEMETMGALRDEGSSIPDLIDYLRAERGFNPEGKPVRHEMATALRKKQFKENTKKIEARSGTAFAVAAGIAVVGIGVWVAVSGDLTALTALPTVIGEPISWALESVGSLMKNLVLGGALIAGWKGYKMIQDIRSGTPKLDLGKDADFADIAGPIGNPNYEKINIQIESMRSADQHLIKHLSPTELRFFLLGGDSARLHILRNNPPSQRALLEYAVGNMDHVKGWKNSVATAWQMLSAPLRRDKSETGIPHLRDKMNTWRRHAAINRVSRHPRSKGDPSNM